MNDLLTVLYTTLSALIGRLPKFYFDSLQMPVERGKIFMLLLGMCHLKRAMRSLDFSYHAREYSYWPFPLNTQHSLLGERFIPELSPSCDLRERPHLTCVELVSIFFFLTSASIEITVNKIHVNIFWPRDHPT